MKAMILAAGLGMRMRPLTLTQPKPLIPVLDKPLIVWHLEKLAATGIRDVVINHAWLGEKIEAYLGTGQAWGLNLEYSAESEPLETGGGILKALPKLVEQEEECFFLVNADVWSDFDYSRFLRKPLLPEDLGCLVMVENPDWHRQGDFRMDERGRLHPEQGRALTYSGISLLRASLWTGQVPGVFPLAPILRQAIAADRLVAEVHTGHWSDVGTLERLTQLEQQVRQEVLL
ncbi:N-acetylmuramate alpha-1-phosphate uridylyltransferase MurU [Nitrincola tapanii]|uniref:Nucleotidyltransferase family protein n=1 Tax=Nitrincola tapanii TaxID=1708751 RepID=A0A5A9W1S2_9GAMM|nr:nucleotidyltransferase family protein [Nitrincola tapanii]KAA0874035.1 nucleotidyltransferase family protein [Nitrincola tapanii]